MTSREEMMEVKLRLGKAGKRGKNKMAAQNCRKRKLGQIDELAERLQAARRTQDLIRQEHSKLLAEYSNEEQRLRELSERVLRFQRKDPSQWFVQVTGDDVHFRHKTEVPEHERFPPPLEKPQATFHRLIGSDWQDPA